MGTRKLYDLLQPFMNDHSIKMGRDALFDLLAANKLLVRKRKRNIQTTYSNHWLRKYPNLIREFIPKAINQLWVSDITYWKIQTGDHVYISLMTRPKKSLQVPYRFHCALTPIKLKLMCPIPWKPQRLENS